MMPSSGARGRGADEGIIVFELRGDVTEVLLGGGHHVGFAEHVRIHELFLGMVHVLQFIQEQRLQGIETHRTPKRWVMV